MITIVNYGSGNIKAFANVYSRLNIPFTVAARPNELNDAKRILLPGVGAFDHTMRQLELSGMKEKLAERIVDEDVALLGVCVGMQILGRASEEGTLPGLGWIDGVVRRLNSCEGDGIRLPHMGWNEIAPSGSNAIFAGLDTLSRFYFLHSYYFECSNPDNIIATSEYGRKFACAIRRGRVYGVQFHPEKSHRSGVQLLKNFALI